MRLKRSRLKTYSTTKRIASKDSEGNTYDSWSDAVAMLSAEIWPASGKVQAEMYGERLPYIRNVRINGKYCIAYDEKGKIHYLVEGTGGHQDAYAVKEGEKYRSPQGTLLTVQNTVDRLPSSLIDLQELDGLFLYTAGGEPDYKIISIRPERFIRIEAEKI